MFFRKRNQSEADGEGVVIEIQWGGYYSSKADGKFGVFRLLDFNKDAYHAQLFQEKFDHAPSFDEVKDLKPFMWHAPIAVGGLLNRSELSLVGSEVLDEQALVGYEEYLRQMGRDEAAVKDMIESLISYSKQGPTKVKMSGKGYHVVVTPLEV